MEKDEMKNRILGVAALVVVLVIAVVVYQVIVPAKAAAAQEEKALERIVREGKIKVCYMPWPPVVIKDPNTGEISGEMVDAIDEIASEANLTVEYVESTWGTFAAAVQSGQCDAAIPIFSTIQRATVLAFARPIFYAGNGILIKAGDTRFESIEDFDKPEIRIAVIQGEVGHLYVQKNIKNAQVTVLPGGDISLAPAQVSMGKADAAFTDAWTIAQYAKEHPETADFLDLHPEAAYGINPTTIALRHSDTDLLNFLNTAITDLEANGKLKEFGQKYGTSWLREEFVLKKS